MCVGPFTFTYIYECEKNGHIHCSVDHSGQKGLSPPFLAYPLLNFAHPPVKSFIYFNL